MIAIRRDWGDQAASSWTSEITLVVAFAALSGALVSIDALFGALVIAPFVGILLLQSATARMLFVVLGGMGVLQSSQSLDTAKLVYFAGVAVSITAAWLNSEALGSEHGRSLRPLVHASGLAMAFLALTALVAYGNRTPFESWLRDAAPYFLVASSPILALDAASSPRAARFVLPVFIAVGVLSGLSFATEWVGRRELSDLAFDRLLLPTAAPAAALFCYAASRLLYSGRFPLRWSLVALLLPGLVLLTATRSAVLWLVGPLVILLYQRGLMTRATLRLAVISVVAVVVVQQASPLLAGTFDVERLTSRLADVTSLPGDLESDPSYLERRAQTSAVWNVFRENIPLGAGPGHVIEWSVPWRVQTDGASADTSLSYLGKFGMAGVAVAVLFVIAFVRSWRSIGLPPGDPVVRDALLGFTAITFVNLPLSNPLQDKGFAFVLILLVALALTTSGDGAPAAGEEPH